MKLLLGLGLRALCFCQRQSIIKALAQNSFVSMPGNLNDYLSSWLLSRLPITLWCGIARKRFIQVKCFALLGDDIIIGDSKVAKVYRDVMNRLRVKISLVKKLTSDYGGL